MDAAFLQVLLEMAVLGRNGVRGDLGQKLLVRGDEKEVGGSSQMFQQGDARLGEPIGYL
jgi:hypothetical protein